MLRTCHRLLGRDGRLLLAWLGEVLMDSMLVLLSTVGRADSEAGPQDLQWVRRPGHVRHGHMITRCGNIASKPCASNKNPTQPDGEGMQGPRCLVNSAASSIS